MSTTLSVLFLAMLSVGAPGVSGRQRVSSNTHALLDVPYLPQTPALCGGAAVAMVLRYWGKDDVFPQDFAPLVAAREGGIATNALVTAVRDRGWQALTVPLAAVTARTQIQAEIDRGRPLIALIEVGPDTYHYVVIVGSTEQEVVIHDPARAPFRVLRWTEFDRAWTAAGRWTMLLLPPAGFHRDAEAALAAPAALDAGVHTPVVARTPCEAMVDHGVSLALAGDADGAEHELVAATHVCPDDAGSWRELAGLRFSQSRWPEAQVLALVAVRLAPDDQYAWQLVATSRYLAGDGAGALAAWNHAGGPHVDTIDIHGALRTRQPVIARAAGLAPRQLLTPEAYGRALRRVRDLPVASSAGVKYEPEDNAASAGGGIARIDVSVDERTAAPRGWMTLAGLGARALLYDELRVDIAGLAGAGEMESASWRWSAPRPRVAFDLALPAPQGLPGVVSLDVSWERQTYGAMPVPPPDAISQIEERRRVGLHFSDWSTSWLRWQGGAALDRLQEHDALGVSPTSARDYVAIDGALESRFAGDRVAVVASAGWWAPFAGGAQFGTSGLLAAWRSTVDSNRPLWSAVTEVSLASRVAPLALWEGAGTGRGRDGLLRAHPLLEDDVVAGPVFGRAVARSSIEYARPVGPSLAGSFSVAGFVDAARAWRRMTGLDASPLYVDAGIGVRMRPLGQSGTVRIDLAHGLRGGGTTLSAGWGATWPR